MMKDVFKYENREKLYDFLYSFGFIKVKDEFTPETFGNFIIILSKLDNYYLIYSNDRSRMTISISSKLEPNESIPLSLVKQYINSENEVEIDDNDEIRINKLNSFLKENLSKIDFMFSKENYFDTKRKIIEMRKKDFDDKL